MFTFERARDPHLSPRLSGELSRIAPSPRMATGAWSSDSPTVRRAALRRGGRWHLPAHLLAGIPPAEVEQSPFVRNPVGNGPYRWVRSVPGQLIELAANERFFLGKPGISRVVVRAATDADARINLVLSRGADAIDNVLPPLANLKRMNENPEVRLIPVPSPTLGFWLFNQRDPSDTSRPHPILSDRDVRRAITLSLDRALLVQAVYGSYGEVPYGPASSILWIRHGMPKAAGPNRGQARRLLASKGWTDSDGDGILDRNGQPLRLELNYPSTSAVRKQIVAARAAAAPTGGHRRRASAVRFPGLVRASNGRTLRHRLLFDHPGSVSLGTDAGMVVRRRDQRGALL